MFKKTIAAALIALAPAAAVAADLPYKAPAQAVYAPTWTGFYVGGEVGYVWGRTDSVLSGTGAAISTTPRGALGGVFAGYDYQLPNNLVIGARIAAPLFSSARQTVNDPFFPFVTYEGRFLWAALGTVQLGYAIGNWQPYVGIGGAVGEGEASVAGNLFPGSVQETHLGFVVNAGVKYRLTPNWFVGVHYTHTEWTRETYNFPAAAFSANLGARTDSVVGLVGYKF
jgi:outer membrane immunogenic protein